MEETFGLGIPLRGSLILLMAIQCLGITSLRHPGTPLHKVLLTQKGYIQFLRWQLPVPELSEFTFCLWLQSDDLTHPHPIFSYSKNENERLIRAWISPHGRSVHLEMGGTEVFAASTDIRENRWYHLCQSWENRDGRYALWVNGQLWVQGRSEETVGRVIPSKGDIVLGQEYTDFDKGLEDGIEGSVFGFNLLLASAFDPIRYDLQEPLSSASNHDTIPIFTRIQPKPMHRSLVYGMRTIYAVYPTRSRRVSRYIGEKSGAISRAIDPWLDSGSPGFEKKPLGLQMVQLSYARCELGRGSPFIGGRLMLISWTRTPVRVFGGATLKNANSECGNF